jgi:hypothetical protein
MTDAPERIWVAPWREGDWSEGDWDDNEGKTLNDKPCIQYVRADRIEALTAKLTKAAELLEEIEVRLKPISGFFFDTFPRREIKAILAEIKGESHE